MNKTAQFLANTKTALTRGLQAAAKKSFIGFVPGAGDVCSDVRVDVADDTSKSIRRLA